MSVELGKEWKVHITRTCVMAVDRGEFHLAQREREMHRKTRFLINRNF